MMHVSRKWLQWQSNQQGVQNKAKPSSLKLKFNECEPSSPFIIIQEYACLSVCVSDEAENLFQNIKRYRASAISTTPARDLDLFGVSNISRCIQACRASAIYGIQLLEYSKTSPSSPSPSSPSRSGYPPLSQEPRVVS